MNAKKLRKGISILIIAVLSLTLLLSGCGSEPGSWLPDITSDDVNRIVVEGTRGSPLQYYTDEKIAVMLEYLASFPHETEESADPPEDAVNMKIRTKDGTTFEFDFDEYGVYVDGTAYKSSEPYFGQLAAQASTEERDEGELSLETSPFSEAFNIEASEVESIDMLAINGGRMSFSSVDGINGALDYIGEFPYYYRLPFFDEPEMTGGNSPYILLSMADGEFERMQLTESLIIYDGICYIGPAYFSDMKDALGEYSD